jgi:xylulokinase
MYLGIDLGTSGVKVVLMDEHGSIVASGSRGLVVSRMKPLWSEQNPLDWWSATVDAIDELSQQHDLSRVKCIGLSGQMHGATVLGENGEVLRPAILWNDGRCAEECIELEHRVPNSREITGNIMMPGFTAPKLLWLRKYEPSCFTKIDKVLLPKDYLRYRLSGDFASDLSDASGTMWVDIGARDWSDQMLSATGLSRAQMPQLYEGNQISGYLQSDLAQRWGMQAVPIAAGAGDNAAGAIGVGIIKPKQAMMSLGTSGVYFAVSDGFLANPESALHSFCHALPNTWHTMSVILSAASCLDWVCQLSGFSDVPTMLQELEQSKMVTTDVLFLPYLCGERTPHNNPDAKGVFFGMTMSTTRLDMALAVLEGVGFALADGADALHKTKLIPESISLIGGGARSGYWRQILCDILNKELVYREGGDVGPALGAARLAMLAVETGMDIATVCPVPQELARHQPQEERFAYYHAKRARFQALYLCLKPVF